MSTLSPEATTSLSFLFTPERNWMCTHVWTPACPSLTQRHFLYCSVTWLSPLITFPESHLNLFLMCPRSLVTYLSNSQTMDVSRSLLLSMVKLLSVLILERHRILKKILNWSAVDLQYCVKLCCIAQWLSYTRIFLFQKGVLFHDGLSQDTEYSSLCCTLGPCPYQFLSAHPKLPVHPSPISLPHGNYKPVLHACESVSAL